MSVSPISKHLVLLAGCCPYNDKGVQKVNYTRLFCVGLFLKPILVQIANNVIKSKEYPEFRERYNRIKTYRVHNKDIISTICHMLLTAIWNILSKLEPDFAKDYLSDKLTKHSVIITKFGDLALLRKMDYILCDELAGSDG